LDNQDKKRAFAYLFFRKIEGFLDYIPAGLGFNKSEFEIVREFNNSRVEISFKLKVDKVVSFSGKKIEFNKGDKLLVFFSYKYNKDDMMAFTKMYFDDVQFFTDKKDSYALIVCMK
jgi:uncharacterized SAM-dependent methyltransferase